MIDVSRFGGVYRATVSTFAAIASDGPGIGDVVNFGLVMPEERTIAQTAIDNAMKAAIPAFALSGQWSGDVDKPIGSWLTAKKVNRGKHWLTFWQQTGSCVGNGIGQVARGLSAEEAFTLNEPEKVILPFYLYTYGRSRYIGGLYGQGDGSFGSSAAKAAETDGFLDAETVGLPQPQYDEESGLTWGKAVEYRWSDGARIEQKWLDVGRKHVIRSVAKARSTDDIWQGVANGHYATIASDWGGMMRPPVDDGVLLNRRVTTWQHQMSVHGVYDHPKHGKLFYILNSWGPKTHGICPTGAQPGGFWINEREMAYIVSQGESFIFSRLDGFPAEAASWLAV
jgi:hypothetical protein